MKWDLLPNDPQTHPLGCCRLETYFNHRSTAADRAISGTCYIVDVVCLLLGGQVTG